MAGERRGSRVGRREQVSSGRAARARNRRAAARRGTDRRFAYIVIAVVVVVIAVIAAVALTGGSGGSKGSGGTTAAPPEVVHAATSVSPSTLDSVGVPQGISPPKKASGSLPPYEVDGKPGVLYIGGEYCPYCAAERWSMVVALSRFGTFQDLKLTRSSTSDVYPGTHTFSFVGSRFTSRFVSFDGVEMFGNRRTATGYNRLEQPSPQQLKLFRTLDPSQSFPFMDIGNRYVISGASFNPGVLQGLDWKQIASQLDNPSSQVARAVDGTANLMTAAICRTTGGRPGSVCNSDGVRAAERVLGGS